MGSLFAPMADELRARREAAQRAAQPTPSPLLPEIVNEQAATASARQLRKRRGVGSTILTGEMTVDPSRIGKKTLLGS